MKSKHDKILWIFILEYLRFGEKEPTRDDARGAHKLEGRAPYPGRGQEACGAPVRRLAHFFRRKKDNIWIKIVWKFLPN